MQRPNTTSKKVTLEMTPMIDVVFLLLIFFVMTFKIVAPEGDFSMKMLPASPNPTPSLDLPPEPIRVKLLAEPSGELASIHVGNVSIGKDTEELRRRVLALVMQRGGPALSPALSPASSDVEVELAPDDHLHYAHVISAITAVTGEIQNGVIHPICNKVKFAPRKRAAL